MPKRILIVEDEFIIANDLQLILEKAGYAVIGIAVSGEEADAFISRKPDLVLLDIRLKGRQSGIDIARKLRTEHIAFIYLSANSNQKILEAAKATEPDGFLVKPFREKDLLIALDIAWYRHQHSLESKLRQEEQLRKRLEGLREESLEPEQKLFRIAGIMQSFIPFDFISLGIRPMNAEQFTDVGYRRTGFNEYQFFGEHEFRTISGLQKSDLAKIVKSSAPISKPAVCNSDAAGRNRELSLQDVMMNSLRFQSCLLFPVSLGYGLTAQYCFYSSKNGAYNNDHIALLNRLTMPLQELAGNPVFLAAPAVAAHHEAVAPVFKGIIGNHHLLLSALDLAAQAAPYNTSILILGESGTGKEKVAICIHELSPRKHKPLVKINCAAIPPTLIESELFGHEKGAFTGAVEKRKGKFELADGGTIFLDEIGELPLSMQVKLLRVLQEKEIEHVGGSATIKVDVRIIAATNRNLENEVAQGNFRLDLYYRLNVFPITLPPLRERRSDIELLALYFAEKFCKEFNKPFQGISGPMADAMLSYDWPGNIREMENVLEQSVVLNNGKDPLELKRKLAQSPAPERQSIQTLEDVKYIQRQTERDYIISVLKQTKGRIRGASGAAEILNINPSTLESKMAKLGIRKEGLDV
ncbi:sigma-54-dependent transcriptional regulator [Flavihumibacter petaseus]|uniref:Putative two-component response regulator n=1 Tax=Flavihumibacter petaseus NBRC 106054 TaxID=1220578 RepID=A0A0E9N4C1_9BACT|nr:sigma-54 dependent transcriptional regulator [Flavihumibacter petaseus]GAO44674.1 putative two-component response regulator [Flavihumibacter petaseus NBRC 106054]